jgi:negative modulator of initiation of replication
MQALKALDLLYALGYRPGTVIANRRGAMIRSIQVEDDIYQYLLSKVTQFGESESDVLRRELGISAKGAGPKVQGSQRHELADALEGPEVRHARGVVGKFLAVLATAYSQKKKDFDLVLAFQGRGRTYFAKSREEIEKSGNSTQPRQIPGTPYWVMTNSPTPQKKIMLREALRAMGYSPEAVKAAISAIAV